MHRHRYHGVLAPNAKLRAAVIAIGRPDVEAPEAEATDPPVVSRILLHLDLHHLHPPLSPARAPPQGDFLLDQTSGFDPAEAEPIPDFVFDQSLPQEFED